MIRRRIGVFLIILQMPSSVQEDRERSKQLSEQFAQLDQDFEFMKRNREEWKLQLDARFQDIERKIDSSKNYIASQSKRTNDTLLAFQHKFDFSISSVKAKVDQRIDALLQSTTETFKQRDLQLKGISAGEDENTKERMERFDDGMKECKEWVEKSGQALVKHKEMRVISQKTSMGKFDESLYLMQQKLDEEVYKRNSEIKAARRYIMTSTSQMGKQYKECHDRKFHSFQQSLQALRSEMETTFKSKDELLNSLSKVVTTLQDTLKHPM